MCLISESLIVSLFKPQGRGASNRGFNAEPNALLIRGPLPIPSAAL